MATKTIRNTTARRVNVTSNDGMGTYLRRVFALMFGAVALTAVAAFVTMATPLWEYMFNSYRLSGLYYVLMFGGLALSIWTQVRVFHMKPLKAGLLLALYAILMGIVMTPLLLIAVVNNPITILAAFTIAAIMFACMAAFGYKTVKNLSFLGVFLFIGMIGLILVGIASMFWPMLVGGTFGTIVCLAGVLIFALFTAYDMQNLKNAYHAIGDNDNAKNQLAVLGALHLYISFIAMFQYILSLMNRD